MKLTIRNNKLVKFKEGDQFYLDVDFLDYKKFIMKIYSLKITMIGIMLIPNIDNKKRYFLRYKEGDNFIIETNIPSIKGNNVIPVKAVSKTYNNIKNNE